MDRTLIILFIMAILVVIRHGYYFFQTIITTTEELPLKYKISKYSLFFLGLSIAYIISAIFTGIKL